MNPTVLTMSLVGESLQYPQEFRFKYDVLVDAESVPATARLGSISRAVYVAEPSGSVRFHAGVTLCMMSN